MATIKYELATKVTSSNGKERWQKMGVVFENEKGPFAIIDSIPVGFTGMVSMFEPKQRDDQQQARQQSPKKADIGDDIPW